MVPYPQARNSPTGTVCWIIIEASIAAICAEAIWCFSVVKSECHIQEHSSSPHLMAANDYHNYLSYDYRRKRLTEAGICNVAIGNVPVLVYLLF